jgi:fimbrial chaperone protein
MSLLRIGLRAWLILPALLAVLFLANRPAFASLLFYLTPMISNFAPAGREASQAFQVVNTSKEQSAAIELYMAKREMAVDGSETYRLEEAENDFLIYPPQTFLKPGEAQTVRVTWLGDPNPSKELAYRIIAQQVPLDTDTRSTNAGGRQLSITTLVRYAGSVYITPEGSTPDVVLESAVHQKGKAGVDELAITFHNQGTAHALLQGVTLTITPVGQENKALTLTPENLKSINGENILAESKRRFVIPWPTGLPIGDVKVTFDYKGGL